MIQKVRVTIKEGPDTKAQGILHHIIHTLKIHSINNVSTTKVYRLEGVTKHQAKFLAEKLFCESLNQTYTINTFPSNVQSKTLEIAYKPGVMNPEVASIIKASHDLGVGLKAADTSYEYEFFGDLKKDEIKDIASKLNLYNKVVEDIVEEDPKTLLIKGTIGQTTTISLRKMSDQELLETSKDKLFLN